MGGSGGNGPRRWLPKESIADKRKPSGTKADGCPNRSDNAHPPPPLQSTSLEQPRTKWKGRKACTVRAQCPASSEREQDSLNDDKGSVEGGRRLEAREACKRAGCWARHHWSRSLGGQLGQISWSKVKQQHRQKGSGDRGSDPARRNKTLAARRVALHFRAGGLGMDNLACGDGHGKCPRGASKVEDQPSLEPGMQCFWKPGGLLMSQMEQLCSRAGEIRVQKEPSCCPVGMSGLDVPLCRGARSDCADLGDGSAQDAGTDLGLAAAAPQALHPPSRPPLS